MLNFLFFPKYLYSEPTVFKQRRWMYLFKMQR